MRGPSPVTCRRAAFGGNRRFPPPVHSARSWYAALATTCIGPALIGLPQSMPAAMVGPMRCWGSVWVVPATSHSRNRSVSGWRASIDFNTPVTSVSACNSITGATWSVRMITGFAPVIEPPGEVGVLPPAPRAAGDTPARLCTRNVELLVKRLYAVVVGGQGDRGLRLAGRDDLPGRLLATEALPVTPGAPSSPACRCRTSSRHRGGLSDE